MAKSDTEKAVDALERAVSNRTFNPRAFAGLVAGLPRELHDPIFQTFVTLMGFWSEDFENEWFDEHNEGVVTRASEIHKFISDS